MLNIIFLQYENPFQKLPHLKKKSSKEVPAQSSAQFDHIQPKTIPELVKCVTKCYTRTPFKCIIVGYDD